MLDNKALTIGIVFTKIKIKTKINTQVKKLYKGLVDLKKLLFIKLSPIKTILLFITLGIVYKFFVTPKEAR